MSNAHMFLRSGYPVAAAGNGIGRYVCQLARVTIKFCKSHGSSRGVRDFIETRLVGFANDNPGVVVYVKPRRHRTPVLKAEYLNGEEKWMSLRNCSKEDLTKWLELYRTHSGRPDMRLRKHWHTESPSIQGPWTPQTNRQPALNLMTFPSPQLSGPLHVPKSATEILQEMFGQKPTLQPTKPS